MHISGFTEWVLTRRWILVSRYWGQCAKHQDMVSALRYIEIITAMPASRLKNKSLLLFRSLSRHCKKEIGLDCLTYMNHSFGRTLKPSSILESLVDQCVTDLRQPLRYALSPAYLESIYAILTSLVSFSELPASLPYRSQALPHQSWPFALMIMSMSNQHPLSLVPLWNISTLRFVSIVQGTS
ncbi:hypothetical protein K470DRAFT_103604 [Piedraia hortae CBS 480.64]|uniref:Uncharacterized protein n=1 Tax=Piedraia hortae CBS 480.64 TaxID=1314780 RepID=A0A6A7C7G1_9PEZI|nr:hypothetical protein K470DRAFT_103604 [Piedraia hortae CBS 480.64]